MKFGKRLRREAQPDWLPQYLDYKGLKKQIKKVKSAKQSLTDQGMAEGNIFSMELTDQPEYIAVVKMEHHFFGMLENELTKINKFCKSKEKEFGAVFDESTFTLGELISKHTYLDPQLPEVSESILDFIDLCKHLDDLRKYVVLNYLAVRKILKKFDKNTGRKTNTSGILSKQNFYSSMELAKLITQAECLREQIKLLKPENSFSTPRREKYLCPICLEMLNNPVLLSCAHRFCWGCITKASSFTSQTCCPVCRKVLTLDPSLYYVDPILKGFLETYFASAKAATPPEISSSRHNPFVLLGQNSKANNPLLNNNNTEMVLPSDITIMSSPESQNQTNDLGYYKKFYDPSIMESPPAATLPSANVVPPPSTLPSKVEMPPEIQQQIGMKSNAFSPNYSDFLNAANKQSTWNKPKPPVKLEPVAILVRKVISIVLSEGTAKSLLEDSIEKKLAHHVKDSLWVLLVTDYNVLKDKPFCKRLFSVLQENKANHLVMSRMVVSAPTFVAASIPYFIVTATQAELETQLSQWKEQVKKGLLFVNTGVLLENESAWSMSFQQILNKYSSAIYHIFLCHAKGESTGFWNGVPYSCISGIEWDFNPLKPEGTPWSMAEPKVHELQKPEPKVEQPLFPIQTTTAVTATPNDPDFEIEVATEYSFEDMVWLGVSKMIVIALVLSQIYFLMKYILNSM